MKASVLSKVLYKQQEALVSQDVKVGWRMKEGYIHLNLFSDERPFLSGSDAEDTN